MELERRSPVWQIRFKWEDCLAETFVLEESPALLTVPEVFCFVAVPTSLKFHASVGKTADCDLCPPLPCSPAYEFSETVLYKSSDFFLQPVLSWALFLPTESTDKTQLHVANLLSTAGVSEDPREMEGWRIP